MLTTVLMVMSLILINSWPVMVFSLMVASITMMISSPYWNMMSSWSSIDMLSSTLITLSMWITAMMLIASIKEKKKKKFALTCIVLLTTLVNCFMASNLMMFYIWFEASLIPTMTLIMVWGYQPERSQASLYFIMYTVMASLPMLSAICKIYYSSLTLSMPMISAFMFPMDYSNMQIAWLMCIAGFLVKLPLYSVHLWLPKAHVEAPVAGSMILAAILLKLGGYGMVRMMLLFPFMSNKIISYITSVALIGALITSLICIRQSDLKSLVAYSSVGHMGLMIAGGITATKWGMMGMLIMMIAHGLSSSALFVMVALNYEAISTRSMFLSKGVLMYLPTMSMWWFIFSACSMAAPPSINLLSEIVLITSVMSSSLTSMMLLAALSFFTVVYSLLMYSAVNHGSMSSYTNSYPSLKLKDNLLLLMHIVPSIILIMKPEMLMLWM